jgi:hypothetical protein
MEIFDEVADTSYKKQHTGLSKNRVKYYITELYKSCERYGNKKELILCLKEAWFQDIIPIEIKRLLEDAEEYYSYPNEK